MVSTTYLEPVANRFLLLTSLVIILNNIISAILNLNLLSAVRIEKLVVPEIVAIECPDAVLECTYWGAAADDVTVLWLHNGAQVYEWRQGAPPKVSGVLDGRLDLTYGLNSGGGGGVGDIAQRRALRILELTPELSGDYTCIVRSRGQEARETKSMTVFSPEREFELTFSNPHEPDIEVINIKCVAKRLHPRPDLMIEYNKFPIAQQQQRSWREGPYFDAECVASLPRRELRSTAEISCRLQLPQVDYTVITNKYLNFGNEASGASISLTSPFISSLVSCTVVKLFRYVL